MTTCKAGYETVCSMFYFLVFGSVIAWEEGSVVETANTEVHIHTHWWEIVIVSNSSNRMKTSRPRL